MAYNLPLTYFYYLHEIIKYIESVNKRLLPVIFIINHKQNKHYVYIKDIPRIRTTQELRYFANR